MLSRPLRDRTHIFKLTEEGDPRAGLESFIEAAIADHIVHPERDATLIRDLREQVEAELKRKRDERDNVFVLQFTALGAQTAHFAAHNDEDLKAMLEANDRLTGALEQCGTRELVNKAVGTD